VKLYSNLLCPFVQRVRIGIHQRQADALFEVEMVDLDAPAPAALLAINPIGSVPTVAFGPGDGFNESLVVLAFLDTLEAPGPKLFGDTPKEAAKTSVLLERAAQKVLGPFNGVNYSRGNAVALRKAMASLPDAFEWLSDTLASRGGPYFGGKDLGAIDCALAPFLSRYVLQKEFRQDLPLPREGTPASVYLQALLAHPHVASTSPTFADMAPVFTKYAEPEEGVRAVLKASRAILPNPEESCAALNQALASLKPRNIQPEEASPMPLWKVMRTSKGPHIQARFRIPTYAETQVALETITALQETADHHTQFVIEGYHALDVSVCTHEPVWGLSEKDFTMAHVLTEKLLRI